MLLMGRCVLLQEMAGSARPDSTVSAGTHPMACSVSSVREEGGPLVYQLCMLWCGCCFQA